ncbi:MAG: alpha-glucan family phosphorylase [Candidatus Omnitrophica bacterium]|nr:alpha-glucan family phosphorylase [Candidatus Omnitrophota bacterium]
MRRFKYINIIIAAVFLLNSTVYGIDVPHTVRGDNTKLAPHILNAESSPTAELAAIEDHSKFDLKLLMAIPVIAECFRTNSDHFQGALLDLLRNNRPLLELIEKQWGSIDTLATQLTLESDGTVIVHFEHDGTLYHATVSPREGTREAEALPGGKPSIPGLVITKAASNPVTARSGNPRDMRGKDAPDSNGILDDLIRDGRVIEIAYERPQSGTEPGKISAYRVMWVENRDTLLDALNGQALPLALYKGVDVPITKLFTAVEIANLTAWMGRESNQVRAGPVKFRIALNEPALGWRGNIDHSNIAHAGYRDRCIYIGHFFLKYMMGSPDDRGELRTSVLENDELQHLLHPTDIGAPHHDDLYRTRVAKVGKIIKMLYEINAVRKNMAFMWDANFKKLHDKAEALYQDTATINVTAVQDILQSYRVYLQGTAENQEFKKSLGLKKREVIAYDSMEYALTHQLPFFAGGLGALAGDHARAASDLLPANTFVCVGPFYKLGYLTQKIRENDRYQDEEYERVIIEQFGEIAKDKRGNEIIIELPMPDAPTIFVKAWKLQAGRTVGLFLTTDIRENNKNPQYRTMLDRTYESNSSIRIAQEYIVGVAGERFIRALGLEPKMLHLNEGHVAFAILEKARHMLLKKLQILNNLKGVENYYTLEGLHTMPIEERQRLGLTFRQTLEAVRQSVGFTSHTPVPAGNQVFPVWLANSFLAPYLRTFGAELCDIAAAPIVHDGLFDMTEFALTFARFFNGVSDQHANVCRGSKFIKGMYEDSNAAAKQNYGVDRPLAVNITNAVHRGYYQPEEMTELLETKLALLKQRGAIQDTVTLDNISMDDAAALTAEVSDQEMETVYRDMKENGIRELEDLFARSAETKNRLLPHTIDNGSPVKLDKDAFHIVFGRRMAKYKRPDFLLEMLKDEHLEVLRSIIRKVEAQTGRKVQVIFMGKAHRDDPGGKDVLQRILHVAKHDRELGGKLLFIENYNTQVAKSVIKMANIALNNPLPPEEASGTSGMKFELAGKPSVSVMDGWVMEARHHGVLKGVFPIMTPEDLRDVLVGEWRYTNAAGTQKKGSEAGSSPLTMVPEISGERTIHECMNPLCYSDKLPPKGHRPHVWSTPSGEQPLQCPHCGSLAIKDNSYHELGLIDIFYGHKERWYQIMRESLTIGLGYFTTHRMFKEYAKDMYAPTIEAGRTAEAEFLQIGVSDEEDAARMYGNGGNIRNAIFTLAENYDLANKTDLSVRRDLVPLRFKSESGDETFKQSTVYLEVRMLRALGLLVDGSVPGTYQLRRDVRQLECENRSKLLNKIAHIPELTKAEIKDEKEIARLKKDINEIIYKHTGLRASEEDANTIAKTEKDMADMHKLNAKLLPAVEEEKVLIHIIPADLLPPNARVGRQYFVTKLANELKELYRHAPNMHERIEIVKGKMDLVTEVQRYAQDPRYIVDVAVTSPELVAKIANQSPNAKMLLFQLPEENTEFVHLEGILAALRALHQTDKSRAVEVLLQIHRMIAINELKVSAADLMRQIDHPEELANAIPFVLKPITIIDKAELERLHKTLLSFIQSA